DNPCKNSQKHCIACEIFGCTGWKSTLRISDFHYQGEKRGPRTQPFVAIDRFHGGGKDTALFQAEYFESPKLEGRLTLALKDNSPDELAWRKGLLGLLFRDLREGDIPFGFGASKGYGRITQAEITPLDEITEDDITTFRKKCLENSGEYSCERAKIPERTDQSGRAAITPGNPQDNRIHNPYHFIPAPRPDTGHWTPVDRSQRQAVTAQSHHSHAFYRDTSDDGQPLYHGRIGCRITTETPIFIGAGDADQPQHGDSPAPLKKPYKLNGALAIPAASLRGMISSLTEAASNSAMRELDSEALLSYRKSATPGEALSRLGIIIRDAGNQLKLLPVDGLMPGPNPIILKDAYTAEPMKAFIQGHNSWSPQNNKILYLDPDQIEAGDHNKKYTSSLPADRRSIGYIPGILRILGKEGREDEMPTKKHEWFIPIPDEVKDFNAYLEQQRNRGLTISPQALKNFHQIADQRTDSQKAKRDRR
ncbi:MAG: RAMP superfamily CRISPR-associated protein, partial [Methylococcales bacterium]